MNAKHARKPPGPSSVDDVMAYALAMEAEAAERYAEFADAMNAHNNEEVAALFRRMSAIEELHASQIRESMGWGDGAPPASQPVRWEGLEGPETGDHADLHYLMTPRQALEIARHNEERARSFYEKLAESAPTAEVRSAAAMMAEEEAEHVRLIGQWIERTPPTMPRWAEDPDPPNLGD